MLEDCGYEVSKNLVNSSDYGVAQDRKRVFYVGFRKDLNLNFSFPLSTTPENIDKKTFKDIIWDLKDTALPSTWKE